MIHRLPAETVRFQLIVSGVEDDVLGVGVHQQVAVRGADRAVAKGHFVMLEGRDLDSVRGGAAMAFGIIRDLFGLCFVGGHDCVRVYKVRSGLCFAE